MSKQQFAARFKHPRRRPPAPHPFPPPPRSAPAPRALAWTRMDRLRHVGQAPLCVGPAARSQGLPHRPAAAPVVVVESLQLASPLEVAPRAHLRRSSQGSDEGPKSVQGKPHGPNRDGDGRNHAMEHTKGVAPRPVAAAIKPSGQGKKMGADLDTQRLPDEFFVAPAAGLRASTHTRGQPPRWILRSPSNWKRALCGSPNNQKQSNCVPTGT